MKKIIAILVMLAFIVTAVIPFTIAKEPTVVTNDIGSSGPPVEEFETFSVFESTVKGSPYTTEQIIDEMYYPEFDTYRYYNQDFGWQHTFDDPGSKEILSATLEIRAWDVDNPSLDLP